MRVLVPHETDCLVLSGPTRYKVSFQYFITLCYEAKKNTIFQIPTRLFVKKLDWHQSRQLDIYQLMAVDLTSHDTSNSIICISPPPSTATQPWKPSMIYPVFPLKDPARSTASLSACQQLRYDRIYNDSVAASTTLFIGCKWWAYAHSLHPETSVYTFTCQCTTLVTQ